MLVSHNASLLHYIRADRFERVYSIAPFAGQLAAVYLGVLLVRARQHVPALRRLDVDAAFVDAGVPWLSGAATRSVLARLDDHATHNLRQLQALERFGAPFTVRLRPDAGYSLLVDLDPPFDGAAPFLEWCQRLGVERGLKVNPSYVLGGTPRIWRALYPGRSLLRLNMSYPVSHFEPALARLAMALGERPCRSGSDLRVCVNQATVVGGADEAKPREHERSQRQGGDGLEDT